MAIQRNAITLQGRHTKRIRSFREARMSVMTAAQHAGLIQTAIRSGAAASSPLVASWRRSATLHRLDPAHRGKQRLEMSALTPARLRLEPLLRAAQESLDRLYSVVGSMGCCVLIADRDGVLVERRGASCDDDSFESWGLWTGCVWSEEAQGTNGIGTCLVDRRPVTIHRQEHFLSGNTLLSCTAAPIYDHEGNLAAALDVSSCRDDLAVSTVKLTAVAVSEFARRIEIENFRMAFSSAQIVVAPAPRGSPSCLLALDKEGIVIGATRSARQLYRECGSIIGGTIPSSKGMAGRTCLGEELRLAERAIIGQALSRSEGNVTAAARQLGVSRATLYRKLDKFVAARTE